MFHEILAYSSNNNLEPKIPVIKTTQDRQRSKSFSFGNQVKSMFHLGKNETYGSTVAIHKLRDTKWFKHDETKLFLSVVESGFVVECKEAIDDPSEWGIVMWKQGKEKSKDAEQMCIFMLTKEKNKSRIHKRALKDFWKDGSIIRINNRSDKDKTPNSEATIRTQVEHAMKHYRQMKWHNNQHFVYWCRYGGSVVANRKQQMSDCLKWSSLGMNATVLMTLHPRRASTSI